MWVGSAVEEMAFVQTLRQLLVFLAPRGVWFGLGLAVAAAFEQALGNGEPLWSTVYGFPFLHHIWLAFLVLAVSLLVTEWKHE